MHFCRTLPSGSGEQPSRLRQLAERFAGLLELAARSMLVSLAPKGATRLCSGDQTLLPDGH